MSDKFELNQRSLDSPAENAFAVTTADTDMANFTRAIYVGGAGNVAVTTVRGDTVTFIGVTAGSLLPIRCKQINTASTATDMLGLY